MAGPLYSGASSGKWPKPKARPFHLTSIFERVLIRTDLTGVAKERSRLRFHVGARIILDDYAQCDDPAIRTDGQIFLDHIGVEVGVVTNDVCDRAASHPKHTSSHAEQQRQHGQDGEETTGNAAHGPASYRRLPLFVLHSALRLLHFPPRPAFRAAIARPLLAGVAEVVAAGRAEVVRFTLASAAMMRDRDEEQRERQEEEEPVGDGEFHSHRKPASKC